jgi:hypothetical protein
MVSQAVEGSDVTLPSGGITSILQNAHASTTGILGSSTLTLVCLIGNMLHIANLGDSGVVVCSPKYENGIKWSTSSGQHSFNFPKQLAHQPTVDAFAEREKSVHVHADSSFLRTTTLPARHTIARKMPKVRRSRSKQATAWFLRQTECGTTSS